MKPQDYFESIAYFCKLSSYIDKGDEGGQEGSE